MTRASWVMKARGQSTCPMCQRTINRGQQIGLTPIGWSHVACIIKAARALTNVTGPGMVRLPARPPLASLNVIHLHSRGSDQRVGKPGRQQTHNQRSMKRLLEANGWTETRGGKHVIKMEKPGQRPITLPKHRGQDYSPGLRDAILRQAGLKGGGSGE
jgi:predicted RNA binding protein YcfA (HicA-like mRNA interferase family)